MQAEFLIELGERDDRLEVPWADPANPTNRYYDLKAQPQLLDNIVEAHAHRPLRRFLENLNRPASPFASAKCDIWTTEEFSPGERAAFPAARKKFGSYVDLIFARAEFNFHPEHYKQLAGRWAALVTSEPAAARAELCLRRCCYQAQRTWGYYLTVFLFGYGADLQEAEQQWAAGLAALGVSLDRLGRALAQALEQLNDTKGS